jgi:hypothetical protein
MVWKRQVLVVANVTATSGELLDALKDRAAREPASFTLLVPATPFHGGRTAASAQVQEAVSVLSESGLEVGGGVGDGDPLVAVAEAWDPMRYDEIIVSTLPMSVSKWLHADLPRRIEKLTGALVTHVVAQPPKLAPKLVRIRPSEKRGVMTPFSVLTWGAPTKSRSQGRT